MTDIDLESIRCTSGGGPQVQVKVKRTSGLFLCGPIPLSWLGIAAKINGQAVNAGLAIYFARGLNKTSGEVALHPSIWKHFFTNRHNLYRGLKQLEEAGLISLKRHRGRSARATVIEVAPSGGGVSP